MKVRLISKLTAWLMAAVSLPTLATEDIPRTIPAAKGAPFSVAVQVGDVLYLSGQIGTMPDGKLAAGMEGQARQTMDNIAATLKSQNLSMDNVFKCTVYLADMKLWPDFNKVYVPYFKPDRLPSRSAAGANGLALGALVEVECMAYVPKK